MRILMRFLLLASLAVLVGQPVLARGCSPDRLAIRGPWGRADFSVELANTNASRERGLMFRKSLPRFSGMLFIFKRPQRAMFWMKNTLIPLDMIFIDKTGLVRRIHENAIPHDLSIIDGGRHILAVLEVNGGLTKSLGLTVGSQVQSPVFGPSALWPCP